MFNFNKVAAKRVNSYFSNPKSVYERYINKKWDERKNNFTSKQAFIETAISEWKNSTDIDRFEFLSKKAPERKEKTIKDFFKQENTANAFISKKVNETKQTDTEQSSSSSPPAILISNAGTSGILNAADINTLGRESYLAVTALLRSFTPDNSIEFFAAMDIANDKTFVSALTTMAYRWNEFKTLRVSYENGKLFKKKSNLKSELENIDFLLDDFNAKLTHALALKCSNDMNSFAISQTYLKRAEKRHIGFHRQN